MEFQRIKEYYGNEKNIRKILPYLNNRELALIVSKGYGEQSKRSTRNIRIDSVKDFKWWVLRWSGMNDKETFYNFYHSMAKYRFGIPHFPSRWQERKPQTQKWIIEHIKSMMSYDCLIDIDSPSHTYMKMAKEDAISIREWLDRNEYTYEIRFSGCGFHFIIPSAHFNMQFDPYADTNCYKQMIKMLMDLYNNITQFVDTSVIDSRRVCKIPNTLAIYNNKVYKCQVLKKYELEKFELEAYEYV